MTNDQLTERVNEFLDDSDAGGDMTRKQFTCLWDKTYEAIREAVAQAIEECAQFAERYRDLEPFHDYDTNGDETGEAGEAEAIAAGIRALKDSLNA